MIVARIIRRIVCAITGHRPNPATMTCRTCGLSREEVYRNPPRTILGTWHSGRSHPFDVVEDVYARLLFRLARPVRYRIPDGVKLSLRYVLRQRRYHRAFVRDVERTIGPEGRERLP